MVNFSKQDLSHCENLIKALKKGSFTLDGMEVMAMSQAMSWLGGLHETIVQSLEPKPPTEVADPVSRATKAKGGRSP